MQLTEKQAVLLGPILILAWMYSTSELDELFQILNSVKEFKLNNHTGATQHGGPTEMCIHLGSK